MQLKALGAIMYGPHEELYEWRRKPSVVEGILNRVVDVECPGDPARGVLRARDALFCKRTISQGKGPKSS